MEQREGQASCPQENSREGIDGQQTVSLLLLLVPVPEFRTDSTTTTFNGFQILLPPEKEPESSRWFIRYSWDPVDPGIL